MNLFRRLFAPNMLTFELYTPNDDPRPVYLVGSFNTWKAKDERFRMEKVREGLYRFKLDKVQGNGQVEYKYVKGGWESEELDNDGFPPVNRRLSVLRGVVSDIVPRWKKHTGQYDPQFYPEIQIIAKKFRMPQLRRRRRISVLLPWNYQSEPHKRFPVLYLQDGQNLFEEPAPFGTWGVDRRLASLAQEGRGELIVVAIDHGGKERVKEFLPYDNYKWGEGLGREYARFLAETLKPYIDKQFRTLAGREHTAIGGSSMGGLISLYAGILYPHTFSRFMIFSPSLWIAPKIFDENLRYANYPETRIYLYGGGKEGSGMIPNLQMLRDAIAYQNANCADRVRIRLENDPQGRHNESRWGAEFPKAVKWLFS